MFQNEIMHPQVLLSINIFNLAGLICAFMLMEAVTGLRAERTLEVFYGMTMGNGWLDSQDISVPPSFLHAELVALLEGLHLAWHLGIRELHCFSDFVKQLVEQQVCLRHHYASVICSIQELLLREWRVTLRYVHCEGKQSFDLLAKQGWDGSERLKVWESPHRRRSL